jgi:hypothetical protein
MAVCGWCEQDMATAHSCTVDALHLDGRRVEMIPFGAARGGRTGGGRCGDCGVSRGGWHHLGCDLQRCPLCRGQMFTCGCRFDEDEPDEHGELPAGPLGVDGNGAPTERLL